MPFLLSEEQWCEIYEGKTWAQKEYVAKFGKPGAAGEDEEYDDDAPVRLKGTLSETVLGLHATREECMIGGEDHRCQGKAMSA